jgi:hypothetical protein
MDYLKPRFSVSMPGGSCAWPFQPRELACRPGWAHRFWLDLALGCAWQELHEALGEDAQAVVDEALQSI